MEESVTPKGSVTPEDGITPEGSITPEERNTVSDENEMAVCGENADKITIGRQDFTGSLDTVFALPSKDWIQYAPLTLAYIGDAAYELMIRTIFVKREDTQTQKLHRRVTHCVSAKAQAKMIAALLPALSEEEAAVYRRGRNSKPYTKAKNATMTEYLEATGFEAVMGYLYLNGQFERMTELVAEGLKVLNNE